MLAAAVIVLATALLGDQSDTSAETSAPEAQVSAPAPQVEQETPEPQDDLIVTGMLPEISSDIDRTVYSVRDDPQAQSSPIIDVLGRLPSVTVTSSGNVLLLGNSGVNILVDGRPLLTPNDLRRLPGAQIDRIEVITNPSARNSAQGSAGIINLITRRRADTNWSGTVLANIDSQGAGSVTASSDFALGRWSFNASLSVIDERSEGESEQRRQFTASNDETLNRTTFNPSSESVTGSLMATYALSPTQNVSFGYERAQVAFDTFNIASVTGSNPGFAAYAETVRLSGPAPSTRFTGDYSWTGPHPDETLTISSYVDDVRFDSTQTVVDDFQSPLLDDVGFRNRFRSQTRETSVKLDYRRAFEGDARLETGTSWDRSEEAISQSQVSFVGASPGPDFATSIAGVRDIFTAYGTVQFPFHDWIVKPGLRVEGQSFDILSSLGTSTNEDFQVFPSVFLERSFSDRLTLNLSYSRRTDRPTLQMLDPTLVFSSATTARSGNPDLDPQIVQAFEAKLQYAANGRIVSVILYDRQTEDVFSPFTALTTGGVLRTTTINAGESVSRGGEISLRAPISQRWRYVLTANLFLREQDLILDGVRSHDTRFSYTGSAELNFQGDNVGDRHGDQAQWSLRYYGPRRFLQGSTSGYARADFVYRRPLTDRLTAAFSVTDIFDSTQTDTLLETPEFREVTESQNAGRVFRLSLNYRLGVAE